MSEDGAPGKSDQDHKDVAVADTLSLDQGGGSANASALLPIVDPSSYVVSEEIARGGLGRILKGHDRRLDRPVAIKELLHEGPEIAARFAREALLTARLQHPAVIPVYEAGRWPDGAPFYAMKLVTGRSLEAAIRDAATLPERLALLPHVIHVVEALAYSHGQRIIHRDLKPANVLVGAFGETVVIDWGLAKDLASDEPDAAPPPSYRIVDGHTVSGSVLGTPAYMPPEQALGDPVDEQADVYALGAILYHLLAGEPPYVGGTSEQILLRVVHEPPDDVSQTARAAPPELLAVVRKAMARRPADRYPTAGELAADLHRFQLGQLVSAHRYSTMALLWRSMRRHRAALIVAVTMLALLAAVTVWAFGRVVSERDRARAERAEAQRMRLEADRRGDELALREFDAVVGRDPRQAMEWLARLSPTFTRWGAARIRAADALARGIPFRVDDADAEGLALSPDGTLVCELRRGEVAVKDVRSDQLQVFRGGAAAAAFSPDGQKLAFGGDGGAVRVWDRQVRAVQELRGHEEPVRSLAFRDRRLASASHDGTVRLWDLRGAPPRTFRVPEVTHVFLLGEGAVIVSADGTLRRVGGDEEVVSLGTRVVGAASDGERVAAAGADGSLRVWRGGPRVDVWARLGSAPTAIAFGTDGTVASGEEAGEVRLWRDGAGELLGKMSSEVMVLAFSGDGGTLVSAARGRDVVVWDVPTRRGRWIAGHTEEVNAAALSDDGRTLVTAARDRKVRFWDLGAARPRTEAVPQAAWCAAEELLATAGPDGEVRVAALGSMGRPGTAPPGAVLAVSDERRAVAALGAERWVLLEEGGRARDLAGATGTAPAAAAFSHDGRRLAVAVGSQVVVQDLVRGGSRSLEAGAGPVRGVAFSPGGVLVAAAGPGEAVTLWTVERVTHRELARHAGGALAVTFSPDSHWVASAGADGAIRIASVRDNEADEIRPGTARVTQLMFTPDAARLVSAGDDGAVRVWELARGTVRIFAGHAGPVTALALAPDGRTVASGSKDTTVRLWDLDTGSSRVLSGHTAAVRAVVFAAGAVVSAGEDDTIRSWPDDLPTEPEALRARLAALVR